MAVEVVAEAMQAATGEDQTLSGVVQAMFRPEASANDGSTAVTQPDGNTSKKNCTLC